MKKEKTVSALYAGSFDPFTNGHLDICQRALKIFDSLKIVLAQSPSKKPLLSIEERLRLTKELFVGNERVEVERWDGLTVDYAQKNNIGVLVRGLRPTGDFDNEFQMALMNRSLGPNIETVFLVSDEEKSYISSSLVREIWGHGGCIDKFVPKNISKALKEKDERK